MQICTNNILVYTIIVQSIYRNKTVITGDVHQALRGWGVWRPLPKVVVYSAVSLDKSTWPKARKDSMVKKYISGPQWLTANFNV